jgi:hypothetical protein
VLTIKEYTPAAPKNSSAKLQNMNKAATLNSSRRESVPVLVPSSRSDQEPIMAPKNSKSRPTRNPAERNEVCLSSGRESDDIRPGCTRGLCTVKTASYNQRFRKGRLGAHAPGRSIPQDF